MQSCKRWVKEHTVKFPCSYQLQWSMEYGQTIYNLHMEQGKFMYQITCNACSIKFSLTRMCHFWLGWHDWAQICRMPFHFITERASGSFWNGILNWGPIDLAMGYFRDGEFSPGQHLFLNQDQLEEGGLTGCNCIAICEWTEHAN